jgi:hypothetical protein
MSQMAGLSHYCERDHQRTGTGDDCRQEYWKRRHKLNWTGRSNSRFTRFVVNLLNRATDGTTVHTLKSMHRKSCLKKLLLSENGFSEYATSGKTLATIWSFQSSPFAYFLLLNM